MSFEAGSLGGPYATVLDVGAFRGDFAVSALQAWPQAHVLSFEPLEPQPRRAMQRYHRRWEWFPVALGPVAGTATMHRNEFIPSSSILPMLDLHREAFPYTRGTEQVEVGVATLDEFLDKIATPALLKLDVQGYELEVLRGASEVLTMCTAVVCEISHEPLYEGQADGPALMQFMQEAGFEHQARIEELRHPKRAELLLQSDELWMRA